MNKQSEHTLHPRFALLLLVVFLGILLTKPVHSLFAHHHLHSDTFHAIEQKTIFSTGHCNDCPICDFEFCTFIPQKKISIPQATMIVRNEQTFQTVACLASISTHLFQLRAPPVL